MKNKSMLFRGIIYLVLGILFVVGVSGNSMIGWMISISLLVGGVAMIAGGAITEGTLVGNLGFNGGVLLTLGLILMPVSGLNLFSKYFEVLCMLMIVMGSLYLLDALFGFVGKRATVGNVVMLILGILLLTFGLLLWFDVGGMQHLASLFLGIGMIVYAVLLLISAISGKNVIIVKVRRK